MNLGQVMRDEVVANDQGVGWIWIRQSRVKGV